MNSDDGDRCVALKFDQMSIAAHDVDRIGDLCAAKKHIVIWVICYNDGSGRYLEKSRQVECVRNKVNWLKPKLAQTRLQTFIIEHLAQFIEHLCRHTWFDSTAFNKPEQFPGKAAPQLA